MARIVFLIAPILSLTVIPDALRGSLRWCTVNLRQLQSQGTGALFLRARRTSECPASVRPLLTDAARGALITYTVCSCLKGQCEL